MRTLLLALALAAPGLAQAQNQTQHQVQNQPAPVEQRRPNIVLILADDLGYECLGANGGTSYATPRLDRMAVEGARFTQCYSNPLCTPSRVQLMTGQYSFRNYERFGFLDAEETTFGTLLGSAGYATGVFGKWQLNYGVNDPQRPRAFGFDEWCLWNARPKPGSRYADPKLDINGDVRTFEGGYGPDVVSEHALDFVRRHRTEPFFLYYPMILPHTPLKATPASGTESKTPAAYFADMVSYTDTLVGRLLDELVELEIDEHTLVLFVGDNGTHRPIRSQWNGREIPGGKSFMTMAGTHVPCVAWWPGTVEPAAFEGLVDFTDFLPTLLEAGGVERGADATVDGRSFLPQLRGEPGTPRDWIFCHYDPRWNVPGHPGRFAFDGRFKLYHDGRFYDVVEDRAEASPLEPQPDDKAAGAAKAALQAVLDSMPDWEPPPVSRRPKR